MQEEFCYYMGSPHSNNNGMVVFETHPQLHVQMMTTVEDRRRVCTCQWTGGRCRRQGNTGRQVAGAGTGRQGNMQGVPETNRFHCNTSSAMESSGEGEVERESASESAAGACPDGASESAPARASYCYFSYSCGHLGVGTPPA